MTTIAQVESAENAVRYAISGQKTKFGGLSMKVPSDDGRQVVNFPIPAAGVWLVDNFTGTHMLHGVLDGGDVAHYIIIEITYPAGKDIVADMYARMQ